MINVDLNPDLLAFPDLLYGAVSAGFVDGPDKARVPGVVAAADRLGYARVKWTVVDASGAGPV